MPANTDSPAKLNEKLQRLLNETAGAQNFELESKTTDTFRQLMSIEKDLPADETGLSSYYTLFNAWIRWLCEWDNYCLNLLHRRRLIGHLNRRLGVGKFDLEIYPYATRLYGIQQQQGIHRIQLHEGLDYMNEGECQKLAQLVAAKRWNDLRQLIRDYQRSTPQYMDLVTFSGTPKSGKLPRMIQKGNITTSKAFSRPATGGISTGRCRVRGDSTAPHGSITVRWAATTSKKTRS